MTPGFWRGKRVAVTGTTGFKGAWLTLWLESLGAEVSGYALAPPTSPSLFALMDMNRSGRHETADIRAGVLLTKFCQKAAPEIVLHLAAQALVRDSYQEPVSTFETNVLGTVNLLEAVRRTPSVRAVVVVTTDKCYENRESLEPYVEGDPLGGYDPYSSSKACAEIVAASYRRSFLASAGVGLATARAGNVIGGGDWARDRLVPDIIAALARGEPVNVRNPASVRPWQHVLDPLAGYLDLAERLYHSPAEFSEAWNFGPTDQQPVSVGSLVDQACLTWGHGASWTQGKGPQPHEAGLLLLDASKARQRLGWRPRLPAESAISWTLEWYKAHAAGSPAKPLSIAQIARYEAYP